MNPTARKLYIFGFIMSGIGVVISFYYQNLPAAIYAFIAMVLSQRIININK